VFNAEKRKPIREIPNQSDSQPTVQLRCRARSYERALAAEIRVDPPKRQLLGRRHGPGPDGGMSEVMGIPPADPGQTDFRGLDADAAAHRPHLEYGYSPFRKIRRSRASLTPWPPALQMA
jgi:hypothetical protein